MTSVGLLMNFPPIPEVPEPVRGKSFAILEVIYCGDPADGEEIVAPLRELGSANMDTVQKQAPAGIEERLQLIRQHAPDAESLLERVNRDHPRKVVGTDDVLDAIVTLLTASAPAHAVRRLTATPRTDQLGLPMQMLYARPYRT